MPVSVVMRLVTLGVLGFNVITAASKAAASPPQAVDEKPLLTPLEMRDDYDEKRQMLEEVHPGLYRYSTKAHMDRVFNAGRAELNRPSTAEQFWAVAARTIAQIHCGHTKVSLDDRSRAHQWPH